MPFNEELADRIRAIVRGRAEFGEKRMFGGLAFMLGDKMCCGVLADQLVARVGPEQSKAALKKPHVSPMDFTGRALKGYVYVSLPGLKSEAALKRWVDQSVAFTSTLVGSTKGRTKRKTVSQMESADTAHATPLSKLINFGPVTLPEFKAMGLTTYGQLEDLGWEAVCRKWVENFPERLNANAFIGVIATLEGISWAQTSSSDRARARGLVKELRREYGMPPLKPKREPRRR